MREILAGPGQPVFICGIATNAGELLDLFDRVFLLRIDGPTQEARLARMVGLPESPSQRAQR
jgi:hypothetical protein